MRSKASGGVLRSLPRARLLAPIQVEISSTSELETDWDEEIFSSESVAGTATTPCPLIPSLTPCPLLHSALHPVPRLWLNTPQAPNRRPPNRSLGISLCSWQPQGGGNSEQWEPAKEIVSLSSCPYCWIILTARHHQISPSFSELLSFFLFACQIFWVDVV